MIIDGKKIADEIKTELLMETVDLKDQGIFPSLKIFFGGDNPASEVYVNNKVKACGEVGIKCDVLRVDTFTPGVRFLDAIREANMDKDTHGIIIQLPLNIYLNTDMAVEEVDPIKDVDCLHPFNLGRLFYNKSPYLPCTPAGIIEILRRSGIDLEEREVALVGYGKLVGKPLHHLLIEAGATVTTCHIKTKDMHDITSKHDIIMVAVGHRCVLDRHHLKEGAVVIDVGINRVFKNSAPPEFLSKESRISKALNEKGSVIVGDVNPFALEEKGCHYTPVPGGVGPLTVTMLLKNTLKAAKLQNNICV